VVQPLRGLVNKTQAFLRAVPGRAAVRGQLHRQRLHLRGTGRRGHPEPGLRVMKNGVRGVRGSGAGGLLGNPGQLRRPVSACGEDLCGSGLVSGSPGPGHAHFGRVHGAPQVPPISSLPSSMSGRPASSGCCGPPSTPRPLTP
jgi:hypothetical protein